MVTRNDGRRRALWVGIGVSILLAPARGQASSVLETIGAPGAGNGFSARVMARGAEITYYNPSLLLDASPNLSFGGLLLGNWNDIHLAQRPPGVDVPDSVLDVDLVKSSANGPHFWPQPTSQLLQPRADTKVNDVTQYLALGIVRPLVNDTLVFGAYALIPAGGFLKQDSFFSDEREQYFSNQLHFELLGDRLRVPTMATSLGWRVVRQFSIGAGLDIGMATRTQFQVYIPNAAQQGTLLIVPHIDTRVAVAPYLGLTLRPWDQWLVTATLHFPKSWDTNGENRLRYWDYTYPNGQTAEVQNFELKQGTEPARVGLGVRTGGSLGTLGWQIGLQGVWTQWSQYLDRHGEKPLDAWHDTVTLGLGWSLDWAKRRVLAELGVAPSPVPDQVGQTNYVDNTRLGTSLGVELPFSYINTDYSLGLHVQGQFMIPRSVDKRADAAHPVTDELPNDAVDRVHGRPLSGAAGLQTNNPGYPGYTSWGTMLGASMVIKVLR